MPLQVHKRIIRDTNGTDLNAVFVLLFSFSLQRYFDGELGFMCMYLTFLGLTLLAQYLNKQIQ